MVKPPSVRSGTRPSNGRHVPAVRRTRKAYLPPAGFLLLGAGGGRSGSRLLPGRLVPGGVADHSGDRLPVGSPTSLRLIAAGVQQRRGHGCPGRRDPLLQLLDLKTTLLLFGTRFHGETSCQGLQALKAIEIRSSAPSKRSTRCSSQDGNRSKWPVAGEKGMPMPEPTQGSSIPGVSYIATAGPRGSRKTISPPFMIG